MCKAALTKRMPEQGEFSDDLRINLHLDRHHKIIYNKQSLENKEADGDE